MKKTTVLRIFSALLCAASALFFWIYGAYRWALWRVDHPAPGTASSIGIIGGADGPTAVFVSPISTSDSIFAVIGGRMESYLVGGVVLLAGAVGLFLWARRISKGRTK